MEVISLADYKKKMGLSRGRTPLFVSHLNGKVTTSPHRKHKEVRDMGDRLMRIRSSLNKINKLMVELKKLSDRERRNED